jgi:hypothetical protein
MFNEENLNNISIISFIITFLSSLLILYSCKPVWILKIQNNKIKVYYPLLFLYSFLFSSLLSIIIILFFSKTNYSLENKETDFNFNNKKLYA